MAKNINNEKLLNPGTDKEVPVEWVVSAIKYLCRLIKQHEKKMREFQTRCRQLIEEKKLGMDISLELAVLNLKERQFISSIINTKDLTKFTDTMASPTMLEIKRMARDLHNLMAYIKFFSD
ncbi:uncharacterized protein LOC119682416 [Teleopsis dalmanni]|uniref:uncharacterized protein LOC119682416 n=1 Tax=Teleopsis dalmanni TaxID=139649 RepID=UPI0018CE87CF|nr:uncharacterized protein LOC119682416 [Teleopsis dalmanni]